MAVSEELLKKYYPTIGIETHVQLNTKTKLFSAINNDARSAKPNSLISHIDVGLPGALPVLNEKALELAARAAFALNTKPQPFSKFDRKHYFYPDLPKGYQITQYENPIIIGGHVDIEAGGQPLRVNITRAHLEEDAGKNIHPEGADYSLVDLNRAGTPLLEIVSEPDIHSAAQAKAYARELYLLMKYADVSDADLYHGNMRFDVNISVSQDPKKPGKRAEVKNLNSFRSVENAVNYEIDRQIELLKKGQPVEQETRGWNEATQKTTSQRGKEEAHDYRYMPEPDIPPIELIEDKISEIKNSMPKMPNEWRATLQTAGLNNTDVEILLDAQVEKGAPSYLSQINEAKDEGLNKFIANTVINTTIPHFRNLEGKFSGYDQQKLYKNVYRLLNEKKLSSNNAKLLIQKFLNPSTKNLDSDVETQAQTDGLLQVSNIDEIEEVVTEVLSENQQAIQDVKNGEAKAIGFLVGQVMAKSQGKANPQVTQQIIKKQLGL